MTTLLLIALTLDALFGEPDLLWSRLPHPAVLMGRAVKALDAHLNRGPGRVRGALAVAFLLLCAVLIGQLLEAVPGRWLDVAVAAILLAQRSLVEHVRSVAEGLDRGLEDGRHAVSMIVGRKVERLDEAGVARSAIESGAENLSDGVIAPAFWFLLAGLPGLIAYKALNTADSMIGYRTPRHVDFGWAAARLDDLANLAPARLTAILITLVSGHPRTVWAVVWRDARKHRSPNAGWPESAMAATIGVALSGPRIYDEGPSEDPFLNGEGRRAVDAGDIRAAVRVMWRAWGLMAALLLAITLLA